jgi:hypothetical protein
MKKLEEASRPPTEKRKRKRRDEIDESTSYFRLGICACQVASQARHCNIPNPFKPSDSIKQHSVTDKN